MTIYTHAGIFHADDALAVAIIQNCLNREGISVISRVRELPETFDSNTDIAVDIGGCYDLERKIFDHHFKGGSDDGFAAAGKVWQTIDLPQTLKDRIYLTLIGAIDRADLGISDWSPVKDEWRHLSASALISSMNPPFGSSERQQRDCFYVAVKAMSLVLINAVEQAKVWLEMEEVVKTSEKINQVLILTKGGPWQEHVFQQELDDTLYVIYPSERGGFCLQCVPNKLGGFGMRKPLPEAWWGLRKEEMRNVLPCRHGNTYNNWAVTSALFCHPGGFIAGAETKMEAIELASIAVSE